MTRLEDDNERRRARARSMALWLGLAAVGLYLTYIAYAMLRGGL